MKYEQSIVCPDPECRWVARVEIDTENPLALGAEGGLDPWRHGVIRDALEQARREHVVHLHVRTGTRD